MLRSKEIYFVCGWVCVLRLTGLYKGQWLFFLRKRLRGKCKIMREVSAVCKGLMMERCNRVKRTAEMCVCLFVCVGCTYGNRVASRSV